MQTSKIIKNQIPKPEKGIFPERYKIHQYWSRKPWYVVREHIKNFSNKGDLVLDPFSGSGVTACESLILRRKFVGTDLNPLAVFLTKMTCVSPVDLDQIEKMVHTVITKNEAKHNDLYSTTCRKCQKSVQIINTIWNKEQPKTIFYECKHCNNKEITKVNQSDLIKIKQIKKQKIQNWYPQKVKLSYDSDVDYLEDLFTKRNLIALSSLFEIINDLPKTTESELILLMFLSTLVRCSKLIFVNKYRFSRGVNPAGVWGEKRFWIPDEFIENNVNHYFLARLSKILKGKKETADIIGNFFKQNFQLQNDTATDLKFLEDNSTDYCFTDPPYGGSIHYLDLSKVWNSWLQKKEDYEKEIVVSKTKSVSEYHDLMELAFKEIHRVLRPGKFLSVTFHNSEIKIWNVLLSVCKKAGFELEAVITQDPSKQSHNQIDMKKSVRTDMILTFKKSAKRKKENNYCKKIPTKELVKKALSKIKLLKTNVSLFEIYDQVLILWIMESYDNKNMSSFLSLQELEDVLKEMGIKTVETTEKDYKGEQRFSQKWVLSNF